MPDLDLRALQTTRGYRSGELNNYSHGSADNSADKTCYLKDELQRNAAEIAAIYDGSLSDEAADVAYAAMAERCKERQHKYEEARQSAAYLV